MELNRRDLLNIMKKHSTESTHRRILTDVKGFIREWNMTKISIADAVRLPALTDQYIFEDGSLFCSACTRYGEHAFNDSEILWENSKSSDIENALKSSLYIRRRLYLQTPLGQWYVTEVECSDFRCARDSKGYDRWYFVLTRPGTKRPLPDTASLNFDNEIW
jgi:hypothetical protein